MATTVKQLQRWLKTLDKEAEVGIDDGGLTLIAYVGTTSENDPYFEVGGIPKED